jgi:hypothetical protein
MLPAHYSKRAVSFPLISLPPQGLFSFSSSKASDSRP